ncbi:hypothetical protein [Acinetobacter pragensis]|uniref:Uncharacterized protein n=1 Tax=Acinetobacter pragensis TaxID=1806892 RepID=A0A151Y2Q0_9GAMM|nr:hypothetical protein [Acinetobacter pragensis]KYQ72321.1 hypothetical protein AZH43_10300 [Acinetobacter pragensis]
MTAKYQKNGLILLFSLALGLSSAVYSANVTTQRAADIKAYTLINGGGIDDLSIELKDVKNRHIYAYCIHQCGDWFAYDPESDGYALKKKYQGAKVWASLSYEENHDRIVGPSHDEELYFVKKIKIESIR